MAEYICKVWSADRRIKKTFVTLPSIKALIENALTFGIKGSKVVLESDGTEICGDKVLEHYLKDNTTFMVIENQEWCQQAKANTSETAELEISTFEQSDLETSDQPLLLTPTQTNEVFLMTVPLLTDESITSSDAISSGSQTAEHTKEMFENFKIPWHKMPGDIINLLKEKEKLGKRLNALANCIVDELRTHSFNIPMGIMRSVAKEAVAQYPESLLEKDNKGNIICTNTTPLLTVMRNRNNFLNQSPNGKSSDFMPNIPASKRRRASILKATCTNWQPLDSDESMKILKQKKEYLKNVYNMQSECQALKLIKSDMKECFPLQRKDFNEMNPIPSIASIKENWPYIFNEDCLSQHFIQLTGIKEDCFLNNFNKSKDVIISFFQKTQKSKDGMDEEYPEMFVIRSIMKYFKEDENYLFQAFETGTTLQAVIEKIPTNTPFIAFVGNDITYVFMEKIIIFQTTEKISLTLLIKKVIQLFYTFNLIYPGHISQSMEFFVRNYYKYYPACTRGIKKM